MYASRLSVCPAAALSRQLHSVAMRLVLRLAADQTSGARRQIILGKRLTRIIHESLYCDRHLHAISVRTRASRLDIPPGMPASLIAVCGPI
jgi:hypothetical protein